MARSKRARNLLYFDHWTVGIHNFARLHPLLERAGIEASLLHAGSFKHLKCPEVQTVDGIEAIDISHFGTRFVRRALERLRPDALLMLDCSFMLDRAVILACRGLGIRSIYLQHGVLPDFDAFAAIVPMKDAVYKEDRLRRAIPYLKFDLPNYFLSGLHLDPRFLLDSAVYRYCLGLFREPTQYLFYPPPSPENLTDVALVYSNADRDRHVEGFGYRPDQVIVVGNPNLDDAMAQRYSSRAECARAEGIPDAPYVLYLEDAFVGDGWKGWTVASRRAHLKEVEDCCRDAGYHLVVKLHPQSARERSPDDFAGLTNSSVLGQARIADLVRFAERCVGHISSTVRLPILMGKPLLVPQWGISADLPRYYGEEVVTYCRTIDDFAARLKVNSFEYSRDAYIAHEMTYSDGKAAERIVQAIADQMR
ncbi:MAG: hypothetical protein HY906_26105 [Deltaproteobacteria bacterium]|nr:hypothetical protein [Deltaproteobacteria bacterium]